jgi:hypothetical protein
MEDLLKALSKCGWTPTVVISGTARGADKLGEMWARQNHVPVEKYPADWNGTMRKGAGHVRNEQMAKVADALIALWDGQSKGTEDMIEIAMRRGMRIYVQTIRVE